MQCNLQTVLEICHFFEANVNHQVLRLQISLLFDFALQQVSKVSALQHNSIRSCRTSAHVAERMKIQQFETDCKPKEVARSDSTSQHYFVLQSLHKAFAALLCTTYKVCTNYFPVLLCTTRLAQSTSQYYFELQSLHKALPSTTVYYKACKKYFPVLCTTKLGQSTFQYYFVLQSLHKPRPSTTLYYTKLAPSTTLYYKACTNYFLVYTTLYYEACAKHFPVLLCDTKRVQRKLLHAASSLTVEAFTHSKLFKQGSFYTQKLLHATSFYTEKLLLTASFHTQQAFTHRTLTYREAFTHSKLLQEEVFTQRSFLVHNHNKNRSSKTGSRRESEKRRFWSTFQMIL